MNGRLVQIKTVRDRFEGEVILALLRSEGISALLYADDGGGMAAPTVQVEPVIIRVREEELERSRQVIAQANVL